MGRRKTYLLLMGTCVGLFVLAWVVVRHFSLVAAVVMSVVAALMPPLAAIIANSRREP
ncbi:hypothetical protein F4554_002750 [Actinopolymorpha rutila]|uniref:DUF3099 domain-containing protein n=2 Tax=Actinopolymorpha rutila TaxID=446787 RepID=A0A852ZEG8_9ACTN|nr:hypothetical protein [Actinopolymorpha rutila]